ncbi:uncharacterized protein L969DRAFT_51484 [Mixia osmundae IAM 14324]|uniref:Nuclear movement protein nudC n=1 Tax=Mixia osmundae (strain CBS 9802 / IAM 14324 / JCM 22182 / KY 12970) TaxID=764103 RepID=G7DSL5_MIXOS|nr:uncharacterized protein L969DRAFT_51484 [Mixia osmundae IAM 14324]KEI37929.1 hypothetical protein L969DRAFT_51484 [Mixia osmundae IAM 14324]GAA93575.1 hypothetical protein E5Q_00219 [Mixia osmundae IAM 14324]
MFEHDELLTSGCRLWRWEIVRYGAERAAVWLGRLVSSGSALRARAEVAVVDRGRLDDLIGTRRQIEAIARLHGVCAEGEGEREGCGQGDSASSETLLRSIIRLRAFAPSAAGYLSASDNLMSAIKKLSVAEYDALSPEEQKAHDAERKRLEDEGQASLPYTWRQTLGEVDLIIPVPVGTRARDLTVDIKKTRLKVGLKGKEPIIDGELCKEIKLDDSTWSLDDQKEIGLHLEKVSQMGWWDCVIKGGPTIDTTKINPENSKLSELDGETRAMVEKMMFDNQQKQMGKPTSDEQKKHEMLRKFQDAHPEMDFSNAKMS